VAISYQGTTFKILFSAICARRNDLLVATLDHVLLVVAGGLIVGVDDGVGGHTVGVVRLGPGVDGVNVGVVVEEEGEHFCTTDEFQNYCDLSPHIKHSRYTPTPSLTLTILCKARTSQICP
jgi:hypothetical protein